jgi:hypothetical protein
MLYDLNTFYHSRPWLNLVRILRQERVNEDGNVICEYCGKPIVKAYDIIGHHKVYLTEENVNDAAVSLNPDNIALVHHRCHNYIHNKLGYGRREVYLVYGAPLSGKSEYVDSVRQSGDLIVDVDRIRQCVSGEDKYILVPKLNQIVFGIRNYLYDSIKYRIGKWNRAYIVGGYPLSTERKRIIQDTGAIEVFINKSMNECIDNLNNTSEIKEKDKWIVFIEEWFSRYMESIPPT